MTENLEACEICGSTSQVASYGFYYGGKVKENAKPVDYFKSIEGEEFVPLCKGCIQEKTKKDVTKKVLLALGAPVAGVIAYLLYSKVFVGYVTSSLPFDLDLIVISFLVVVAEITLISQIIAIRSGKEEVGSLLAIKIREDEKKKNGHETLLTPGTYENVKKQCE